MTLTCFEDYRDRMLSVMADAEANTPEAVPADTVSLDLARARMARLLTAYHLYAERELFGPCAALADASQRMRVRAISSDCASIANDFRAFAKACILRPVTDGWAVYRLEAAALRTRIRRHLREAEEEVRSCQAAEIATASPLGWRPAA